MTHGLPAQWLMITGTLLTDCGNDRYGKQQTNVIQSTCSLQLEDLKCHVTLKTGVMMLTFQLCITGMNYILKYFKL